jgi:hypothetical protein
MKKAFFPKISGISWKNRNLLTFILQQRENHFKFYTPEEGKTLSNFAGAFMKIKKIVIQLRYERIPAEITEPRQPSTAGFFRRIAAIAAGLSISP